MWSKESWKEHQGQRHGLGHLLLCHLCHKLHQERQSQDTLDCDIEYQG